jgi:hypothetical protein
VFLQLFKLVKDHGPITKTLKRYGYSYEPGTTESTSDPLLTLMFGEGMGAIWRKDSLVKPDGKPVDLTGLRKGNGKDQESVFFVPAQRVLTLDQGRPLMQVLKTSGFIEVHGASPDRSFRGGRGQESTDDLKLCRVAASFNEALQ